MRIVAAVLALAAPSSAGQFFSIFPDPHFVTVPFAVTQGVTGSFDGPAFQAINTGAGNSFEAYVAGGNWLAGQSLAAREVSPILGPSLSITVDNSLLSDGVPYNTPGSYRGSAVIALADPSGFATVASHFDGTGNGEFDGAHVWVGKHKNNYGGIKWETFADESSTFLNLHSHRVGRGGKFAFSDVYNGGLNVTTLELRTNGYVWDWRARSAQTGPQASNTKGGWRWYIASDGPSILPIHTDWSDSSDRVLMRVNHAGGLQLLQGNSLTLGNGSIPAGSINPGQDNTGTVGTSSARWASVRAAVVTTGDLGFDDEKCAVCGKPFSVGDDVVWRIRKQAGGVSYAVPIHVKETR